jgi:flagellar biosynthesis protein FlhF
MSVKTYHAKTMQEALALVRRDLGPTASVLRTRQVRGGGLLRLLGGHRLIEVVASTSITVPSRLPRRRAAEARQERARSGVPAEPLAPKVTQPPQSPLTPDVQRQILQLQVRLDELSRRSTPARPEMPESLFRLFVDLIEADVSEDVARDLVERLRGQISPDKLNDAAGLKASLARLVESEIRVAGPIDLARGGRRLVTLVGPTGVGKTTTIAKLAANFRLRDKRRVGLITVDTYRIAAVEQLRTYADIIDLPMEIVATRAEMKAALARMADLEVVLMDTAGRSPRDEVKLQELQSMLAEAMPDEVHLVLSSVTSAAGLSNLVERFSVVGATALVLTKLDEAASLGNLLGTLRGCRLPLSYLTHGQNVPDDIAPAEQDRLARVILGQESIHLHPTVRP